MPMSGADVEALDRLAAQLAASANMLSRLRRNLGSQVHNTTWRGHSADNFRSDWNRRHAPAIAAAAASIQTAKDRVALNAQQQRAASAATHEGIGKGNVTVPAETMTIGFSLQDLLKDAGELRDFAGHAKYLWDLSAITTILTHSSALLLTETLARDLGGTGVGALFKEAHLGPLNAVFLLWDSAKVGADLSAGKYADALWDLGHVGLDVVSIAAPELGLAVGAFELGALIGRTLDERYGISDSMSTFIQDETVERLYGTTTDGLTPSQAAEYSRRYDGVPGLINFFDDAVDAPVNKAQKFLSGLLR